jgi:hypothetical protein
VINGLNRYRLRVGKEERPDCMQEEYNCFARKSGKFIRLFVLRGFLWCSHCWLHFLKDIFLEGENHCQGWFDKQFDWRWFYDGGVNAALTFI